MAVPHDQLLQLLQQVFDARVELIDCQIGNQLEDYLVLLVHLRHPTMKGVVKLAGPQASLACPFERVAMLHRLVEARTAIPMPEILAVDTSCQAWPWRYIVKTHVPGLEWADAKQLMNRAELSDAYRQLGNAAAQLHTIHFPLFGELATDGSIQGAETYVEALQERARSSIRNVYLRDLFFAVLQKRQSLFLDVRRASLCHEDLHKYNVLFGYQQGQWRLATILDFEKAWAGHHETDLARLELWEDALCSEFWEAYEALCPIAPLYEERRAIYQLLWCFEYARPTRKHLADTQRLCGELGLPCSDADLRDVFEGGLKTPAKAS